MKKILSLLALAALTVGLLGSCSKINERLDNLEKEVSGIENEQIASINSQIDGIKTSIADLGTIRSDISSLKQSASDHSVDIFNLEEADRALKDRILNLEDYVDAVLPNYAEKEWVEATFSTLEQYEATCDTIAKIDARIGALDTKLSKDIKATADSLTKWVNKQFEGYYTAAEMDASLAQMKSAIDSSKASGKITDAKADSIATELTNAKAAVDTAKANIRKEYRAAIDTAIKASEGKLTKALTDKITTVNGKIESLTTRVGNLETSVNNLLGRVIALEEMIQSVVIVPAYSDGSVEVKDDTLSIDFAVTPKDAMSELSKTDVKILLNKVQTKAVALDTVPADSIKVFTKDTKNGTVSIKANISEIIANLEDMSLTMALNVSNGISDFTTEFVPVYVAGPDIPEGALKGVFTVSAGPDDKAGTDDDIKVHFSQGNLVATIDASGAPTAWKFATNQYDYLGEGGANKTIGTKVGDVDLFGWSTDATSNNWGIHTKSSAAEGFTTGNFKDWGATIDDKGTWRTLSKDEWTYLFNNHSKKWATVNGVGGYVIAPDDFAGTPADTYADDAALAANNLVFLPAAGHRLGSSYVFSVGDSGYYWSSTVNGSSDAYDVEFTSSRLDPKTIGSRHNGYSVRLITESK